MSALPSRGRGPWRRQWYSACSMHRWHDPECRMCTCGYWINAWQASLGRLVFRVSPSWWHRLNTVRWVSGRIRDESPPTEKDQPR